jgi:hypothetical protein
MENVNKTVIVLLLIGAIAKTLHSGAQLADSLIILGLCGLNYMLHNLKYNKDAIKIQEELANLRTNLEKYETEIAETKQYVSSVKMAGTLLGKK